MVQIKCKKQGTAHTTSVCVCWFFVLLLQDKPTVGGCESGERVETAKQNPSTGYKICILFESISLKPAVWRVRLLGIKLHPDWLIVFWVNVQPKKCSISHTSHRCLETSKIRCVPCSATNTVEIVEVSLSSLDNSYKQLDKPLYIICH